MSKYDQPEDKIDLHNRQQLSALVDGELASDEARFLLRRLQHDPELQACQERWALLGDVMRGKAVAPAPLDFAARVSAALAQEPVPRTEPRRELRSGWRRWSGGAALAASVAAVAFFMGRQSLDDGAPPADLPVQVIASQAELALPASAPVQEPAAAQAGAALVASVPAAAVAAAARRQDASARRASATRSQQVARVAQRNDEPQRALAAAPSVLPATLPGAARRGKHTRCAAAL
ncbi:MAG: sigma-E factor negative regulatory protein, partial [Stenotrophomonas sp.]|nr:sigma-E factor negative regulatory protein [Stenotrophomonas sp.]